MSGTSARSGTRGRTWPGVVRELVRVTRPGGWIELVEASGVF
ncbi:hypothetical protein [Thermogemmatispora tikiterensis]|nr:hypothetical protein [Thermogemmatispora tikiterensis]